MSDRWTRRDDEAVRAQVEAERYARDHVIPRAAALFGVDPEDLYAVVRVDLPCTHLWCRVHRFVARNRARLRSVSVALACVPIVTLFGLALWGRP